MIQLPHSKKIDSLIGDITCSFKKAYVRFVKGRSICGKIHIFPLITPSNKIFYESMTFHKT
jgi:hypothetical protein